MFPPVVYESLYLHTLTVLCVTCVLSFKREAREGRDSIFVPHHFAFNTGLGKQLDLNHAVWSVVVKDLNFVIRLSGYPNISFLNYEMG